MAATDRIELRAVGADEPVTIELNSDGSVTVRPGGTFGVTPFDSSVLIVRGGERSVRAYVAGPPERPWVFVDGSAWELEVVQGRAAPSSRTDLGLTAPMPATVVRIVASAGEAVRKDDVLLVLEAMKMELPIRAPRDGRVTAIRCAQGELVQPGAPLLDFE
jgi:biotin carboxyl carrier protein